MKEEGGSKFEGAKGKIFEKRNIEMGYLLLPKSDDFFHTLFSFLQKKTDNGSID